MFEFGFLYMQPWLESADLRNNQRFAVRMVVWLKNSGADGGLQVLLAIRGSKVVILVEMYRAEV